MKVAYIYPATPTTDETYTALARRSLSDGKPDGLLLHVAGRDEDGQLRIVEVWETEEARQQFGEQKLFPLFKEFGIDITEGPDPLRMEVTNLIS
jgi:hypothetical protein